MIATAIGDAIDIKGYVEINAEECKGCGLCVEACAQKVLSLSPGLSRYGYHTATNGGKPCNGCGLCFYVCPEPGGIKVFKAFD
jgi:2-oxoglutarate ferredoxin oxidoreductase subunit delta